MDFLARIDEMYFIIVDVNYPKLPERRIRQILSRRIFLQDDAYNDGCIRMISSMFHCSPLYNYKYIVLYETSSIETSPIT